MRRIFMMAFAICLVMAFGASSAMAKPGGGQGSGKPCPDASPVGQINEALGSMLGAPSCGNQDPGGGNGGGNGGGGGPKPCKPKPNKPCPPNGGTTAVCENADVVLLTEDAKILCLYFPPTTQDEIDEECPEDTDPLLAVAGPAPLDGGLCLYLPPAEE
jgi:hypothetical protein